MSCTQGALHVRCSSSSPRRLPLGYELRLRTKAWRHLARLVARWIARGRQRHDLARLDDHLLEDIGVTRAAATREAAKPFWRE